MIYIHVRDDISMHANRRSECTSVNEMKSALFSGAHNDRIVGDHLAETF